MNHKIIVNLLSVLCGYYANRV